MNNALSLAEARKSWDIPGLAITQDMENQHWYWKVVGTPPPIDYPHYRAFRELRTRRFSTEAEALAVAMKGPTGEQPTADKRQSPPLV